MFAVQSKRRSGSQIELRLEIGNVRKSNINSIRMFETIERDLKATRTKEYTPKRSAIKESLQFGITFWMQ